MTMLCGGRAERSSGNGEISGSLGANVRAKNDYAMRMASYNGHLETVKYLVSQGANIRANNDYVVQMASREWSSGNGEIPGFLGANVRADNDYAVQKASENGHLETVKYWFHRERTFEPTTIMPCERRATTVIWKR